ncbi:MAG: Rpn family recombination-promoting nuclease/putative transposase [Puniceicoccales bacterium]|jgi:hypothetical protein|nr:Rpn family recombination-promoting nuclease/putative transposase [Puniceicoccales bacterium]
MNRYNGPPFEGFDMPVNGTGITHFIKATSNVGFKAMLSDPEIAESLINELFKSIHLAPIRIADEGRLEVPLQGHGSFTGVDYHAITTKREHIIIEMQMIRHDNFDKRVLFYAASTFANQEFEGGEWAPQIKDVYTIQFVDYFTQDSNPVKYYEMVNKLSLKVGQDGQLLPYERISGIYWIQVELKGESIRDIKFPVQGELTELEWWWYVIKYSNQFDSDEIECCKLEGELKGLLDGFIDFQKIPPTAAKRIKETEKLLPRSFVEEVGNHYINEGKISQEQLEHFIELLRENGILAID